MTEKFNLILKLLLGVSAFVGDIHRSSEYNVCLVARELLDVGLAKNALVYSQNYITLIFLLQEISLIFVVVYIPHIQDSDYQYEIEQLFVFVLVDNSILKKLKRIKFILRQILLEYMFYHVDEIFHSF